jgi:phosphatidylglycerophosphatase A
VTTRAPEPSTTPTGARPPLWVTLVATSCGAGLMPYAPGHTGTATAVALAWALGRIGAWAYGVALFFVLGIGTIAAERWGQASGRPDDQRIVIDEVAGYLATVMLVPRTWPNLIVGFVLFRVLDVWKPGPIGRADERIGGGVGVMADDLVAGIIGAFIMLGLHASGAIPWVASHLSAVLG